MDTITSPSTTAAAPLLQALADHDFDQLAGALEPDATMRALLPSGVREWSGAPEIGAAFERWFGDTSFYAFADSASDRIGDVLALSWRLRLRAERFGDVTMAVEQRAYAATGTSGRIARLSLLCSGFWPLHADDAGQP